MLSNSSDKKKNDLKLCGFFKGNKQNAMFLKFTSNLFLINQTIINFLGILKRIKNKFKNNKV